MRLPAPLRYRAPVGLALGLALLAAHPAEAALSQAQLDTVVAAPAPQAAVPLDLSLLDDAARPVSLGDLLGGRPSLLILADYRCTQLCGSILGIASQALHASGLHPGTEFNLLVVNFNPGASPGDGAAMRRDQLDLYPDLRSAARFLTGSPASINRLEQLLGFTAVRDAQAGRFAHPAELFVLTPDGRVARLLDGLAAEPETVRLALVEAGQGLIGTLADRLHILCYGLDPLSGASNAMAQTMLRLGAASLLAAGGLLGLLVLRRRAAVPGGKA
jgi:protein SCO1/2